MTTSDQLPRPKESLRELIITCLIIAAILVPVRYYVAQPFIVSGASMDPTFATGQYLIVDELSFHFHEPARQQVIILEYPKDPSTYFIKRIIGLPNETVSIVNGKVTITNPATPDAAPLVLDEPYIDPRHASHDNYTITLSPTEYFVMGDNRAESSDSRSWGPLERDLIVGRPIVRLYPLNTLGLAPGALK